MSIVGLDIGSATCYISVAKGGGIESIANDYSMRSSPSYVAFGPRQRLLCVAAKNQLMTNLQRTYFDFKSLLGRKYDEAGVAEILTNLPYKTLRDPETGDVVVELEYMEATHRLTPVQLTAMLLTKLKKTVEDNGNLLKEAVISVPFHFNDRQRRALLDASHIANINTLKIMNDTTATALAYGIYKQDLPAPEEPSRNVLFVDCGHEGVQLAACSFNRGKLVVKSCASRTACSGRAFNMILAQYFTDEIEGKYKALSGGRVRHNVKAQLKLIAEGEKLKMQMSANSNRLPLNIECFMDDIDVSTSIDRTTFEQLIQDKLAIIGDAVREVINLAQWQPADISAVELIGGSSRVPAVKALIASVFGNVAEMAVKTTMNADEAVSRGCALQCALLSPTFRVREFAIADITPYAITLDWSDLMGDGEGSSSPGEMTVFDRHHTLPYSKVITFTRPRDMALNLRYHDVSLGPVGHFEIGEVKPLDSVLQDPTYLPPDNGEYKVKVKARLNQSGLVSIASASRVDRHTKMKQPTAEMGSNSAAQTATADKGETANGADGKEAMDVEQNSDEAKGDAATKNEDKVGDDEVMGDETKQETEAAAATKVVTRNVTLPVTSIFQGALSQDRLANQTATEHKFVEQDRTEQLRQDARNAVEEYVYDFRSKLSEQLAPYATDAETESIMSELTATEDWLYSEGEDVDRNVYLDKVSHLRKMGEPIVKREYEDRKLPHSIAQFASKLADARKTWLHIEEDDAHQPAESRTDEHHKQENGANLSTVNGGEVSKNATPPVVDRRPKSEKYDNYDVEKMANVNRVINEHQQWLCQVDGKLAQWDRKSCIFASVTTDSASVEKAAQQFHQDVVVCVLSKIKIKPLCPAPPVAEEQKKKGKCSAPPTPQDGVEDKKMAEATVEPGDAVNSPNGMHVD